MSEMACGLDLDPSAMSKGLGFGGREPVVVYVIDRPKTATRCDTISCCWAWLKCADRLVHDAMPSHFLAGTESLLCMHSSVQVCSIDWIDGHDILYSEVYCACHGQGSWGARELGSEGAMQERLGCRSEREGESRRADAWKLTTYLDGGTALSLPLFGWAAIPGQEKERGREGYDLPVAAGKGEHERTRSKLRPS